MTEEAPTSDPDPVAIPIDGVLDLHLFRPAEVKDLVPTYLEECRERGIFQVRIIHGKGTGALRETVHAVLRRTPAVLSFGLAHGNAGGWGATVVELKGMG
jgi:dsDNA-specific endonuclease/ATPase MutS2